MPHSSKRRGPKKTVLVSGGICRDCGTSETTLWRGGPTGEKSLCNACGIRWKRQNGKAQSPRRSAAPKSQKAEKKVRAANKKGDVSTTMETFLQKLDDIIPVVQVVADVVADVVAAIEAKPKGKLAKPMEEKEPKIIVVPCSGAGKYLRQQNRMDLTAFFNRLAQSGQ